MTELQAIQKVEKATKREDLFPAGKDEKKIYLQLSKLVHPDHAHGDFRARAEAAFQKLSGLYHRAKTDSFQPITIGKWVAEEPMRPGDICDLYRCSHTERDETAVLKIARSARDNDLLMREAEAIAAIRNKAAAGDSAAGKVFAAYTPLLHESFQASGRRVNILQLKQHYVPLSEIVEHAGKLDFRHIVWMMKRLLNCLGWSARCGIVHGAITPEHLLYEPVAHHLALVDWCYSVNYKGHVPAIVQKYEHFYPPEVKRKRQATPATDIYMACAVLHWAARDIPKRFRDLFNFCRAESPASRPEDPWWLQDSWGVLAKEEFGPSKYVKLEVPVH